MQVFTVNAVVAILLNVKIYGPGLTLLLVHIVGSLQIYLILYCNNHAIFTTPIMETKHLYQEEIGMNKVDERVTANGKHYVDVTEEIMKTSVDSEYCVPRYSSVKVQAGNRTSSGVRF